MFDNIIKLHDKLYSIILKKKENTTYTQKILRYTYVWTIYTTRLTNVGRDWATLRSYKNIDNVITKFFKKHLFLAYYD